MDDIRGDFRHALIPLAAAAAFGSAPAHAQDFDDRWYFAPMASYVLADDDRHTDDAWGGALAIGKRLLPRLELELRGQYLKYETDEDQRCLLLPLPLLCTDPPQDTEITSGGVGASYFLLPSGRGLFAHADALFGDATLYNVGLGFDIGSDVALRVEALYHIDDDASVEETQFNLGLRIPIGQPPAPPRPEPVRVVEPVEPPPPKALCSDGLDNDGDGAIDYPSDPGCTSAIDEDETNVRCETPAPGQPVDFAGCAVGDSIVLNGVNFEFDKATLTVNAKTLLDQVADALERRSDIKVEVAGHTDSKGSDAYNQKLSKARAESVVEYLGGRGIEPARMTPRGYGESMPVADNETDAGRELNRRVELKVLESSAPLQTSSAPALPASATAPAPAAMPYTGSTVVMEDYTFVPAKVVVAPGTTVTWNNADTGHAHVVAFADGDSDRIAAGGSYSRSFDQPGEYAYECSLHPSMRGTVVVQ